MKKWIVFFVIVLWGCSTNVVDDFPIENPEPGFNINVPDEFSWSAVNQDITLINLVSNDESTILLDGTPALLYNMEEELLDALIICKGKACFNYRIPAKTEKLKVMFPALSEELEFSVKKRSLNFNVPDDFKRKESYLDSDGDGLYDEYDAEPANPRVTFKRMNEAKCNSFYIFEDLWPSKGDFDFNDVVIKTNFRWVRGQGNYITEITGICSAQWENPEFGIGLELFEAKGSYLIYLDEMIEEVQGSEKVNEMQNGLVVFKGAKKSGNSTARFTLKIKDNSLTDFVFIPFIYRLNGPQHQIRPFGTPPTQVQKLQFFRSGDDASPNNWQWEKGSKFQYPLTGENAFYRTGESLPWCVQFMAEEFIVPAEMQSITESYPKFKTWAESSGALDKDWYNHPAK